MNKNANLPLSRNFVTGRPSDSSYAVATAIREAGRPIRHAKVRFIEPDTYEDFAIQPEPSPLVNIIRVDSLKGNKQAVAVSDSKIKRFPITVKDRVTGLPVELLAKLEMREVGVLCYGVAFTFSCKAGSRTAVDSRTGKRVSLDFVKSELNRMLGVVEGETKFQEFVA